MGNVSNRLAEIARRCDDLSAVVPQVREILITGNRERALAGTDAQGQPFAPLAKSTQKRRQKRGQNGKPLAPRDAQSRVVTAYLPNVSAGQGRLSITASWPSAPWMEIHHSGGAHLPRRDPYGFREKELEKVRELISEHILEQ